MCKRLGGTEMAQQEQGIIYIYIFFLEKEMRIINWEQHTYTTEYYQQFREKSLLTIGCHI